jgi:hypothetical protein
MCRSCCRQQCLVVTVRETDRCYDRLAACNTAGCGYVRSVAGQRNLYGQRSALLQPGWRPLLSDSATRGKNNLGQRPHVLLFTHTTHTLSQHAAKRCSWQVDSNLPSAGVVHWTLDSATRLIELSPKQLHTHTPVHSWHWQQHSTRQSAQQVAHTKSACGACTHTVTAHKHTHTTVHVTPGVEAPARRWAPVCTHNHMSVNIHATVTRNSHTHLTKLEPACQATYAACLIPKDKLYRPAAVATARLLCLW